MVLLCERQARQKTMAEEQNLWQGLLREASKKTKMPDCHVAVVGKLIYVSQTAVALYPSAHVIYFT